MKIDHKKFSGYSEKTQQRIIVFARFLLSIIEIYKENKIPLFDFKRESFSYAETYSLVKELNDILGEIIVGLRPETSWSGPRENRTSETYVYLKYKPDTTLVINSFLERIHKSPEIDNNKLIRQKEALSKMMLEDKINSIADLKKKVEDLRKGKEPENTRAVLTPENGHGLFCIGNKSIKIGLIEKVPYKLLETLLPFGTIKRIDTVFKTTNPITGKYSKDSGLSIKMKESILKDRLKELQRILKKEKVHVSLLFDNYQENVSMKYKSG